MTRLENKTKGKCGKTIITIEMVDENEYRLESNDLVGRDLSESAAYMLIEHLFEKYPPRRLSFR